MDRGCGDFSAFLGKTAEAIPLCEPCCSREGDRSLMMAKEPFQRMPSKPSPYTMRPQNMSHSAAGARTSDVDAAASAPAGNTGARTPPPRSSHPSQSTSPAARSPMSPMAAPMAPPSAGSAASFESASFEPFESARTNVTTASARSSTSHGSPVDEMCSIISRSRLCQGLPPVLIREVLSVMRHHFCREGEYVVRQGEAAYSMFFVLTGQLGVMVGGKQVALLCKGDFFGESALCSAACAQIQGRELAQALGQKQNVARHADCRALATVELVELDAAALMPFLVHHQDIFDNYSRILKGQAAARSAVVPNRSD